MIRSRFFWIAAIAFAAIPFITLDIPKHYVDWTREVHDEMIHTVYNHYKLSQSEKTATLDNILYANKTLTAMMYIKSFIGAVLLFLSIYCFTQYRKQQNTSGRQAVGITFVLLIFSVGIKVYSWTSFSGNDKIKLLSLSPADTSVMDIYNSNFKGKVLYVDFWGTTCGPCLEEFRSFTKPVKQTFHNRNNIAYLYICGGRKLIWKQQLQKLDVEGSHIFLDEKDYVHFFRQAIKGDKDTTVAMPRYLIIGKDGKIADTNAPRPSEKDSLINQLNKYLAIN
jgi:thiol-disulfide isomerase/thioredoxin